MVENHENDRISSIRLTLKKMAPIVGIYIAINVAYLYYNVSIIKNPNFKDINNPVFIISSAIYWFILIYYDRKYATKRGSNI